MRNRLVDLLEPSRAFRAQRLLLDGNIWRTTGRDPQIIYNLGTTFGRGAIAIELDIETIEGKLTPRIYIHGRRGFSQQTSQAMRRVGAGRYKIAALLFRRCKMLRFDPAESECTFRIRKFSVTRTTLWTFLARALRDGENRGDASPRLNCLLRVASNLAGQGVAFERGGIARHSRHQRASYQQWINAHDFDEVDRETIAAQVRQLKLRPSFSVLMPVYNTPPAVLDAAIESVVNQIYQNWELCIANDASTAPWIRPALDKWQAKDPRIKIVHRKINGHISEATNSAFELATGDYVAMLDHDDVLRPHALAEVAFAIERHPGAQLIYSDEDKIDDQGRRFDPYFKPEWNLDLFLGQNYLNHLTVHRAANIRKAGGWRRAFDGSQDYDLNLRIIRNLDPATIVHVPKILYHWRAVEGSVAKDNKEKTFAVEAAQRAIADFFARAKINASVERVEVTTPSRVGLALPLMQSAGTTYFRVRRTLPHKRPFVSLIIPTRNRLNVLRQCIESIQEKTTYTNYEILIIDNNSDDVPTLDYLKQLKQREIARVIKYRRPFNYSAINNFAVRHAKGRILGFLNNDTEVISPDWLDEMVSHAVRPEVGCVGAMLYYPNDTIQHAGVVIGLGGVAGHSHKYFDRSAPGYFGRLRLTQQLSAVTAACLLVRKKVFEEVGGSTRRTWPSPSMTWISA